jgi:predicted nucleic acid-binding protein
LRRWLLDTNVVLDFILDRPPFGESAKALWAAAERREIEIGVSAHAVTTAFYVAARVRDAAFARRLVADLLLVPSVAPVDAPVLRRALALGWPDFEDAVCAAAAEAAGFDLVVTRDQAGFVDPPLLVVDPSTALSMLGGSDARGVAEVAAPYGARGRRQPSGQAPSPRQRASRARRRA